MPRSKSKKPHLTKVKSLLIRLSERDMSRIKLKANFYTDGNVSDWVRFAAINCGPPQRRK